MPIYAYRCSACGHAQDVLQKISDPVLDTCPACGAAAFVKQLTAAGFQLKGSGWYVTDFRGNGAAAANKDDAAGGAAGKAADGGAGKGEDKAAAKGDGKGEGSDAKSAAAPDAAPKTAPGASSGTAPAAAPGSGAAPAGK